jgi:hypothetical protein
MTAPPDAPTSASPPAIEPPPPSIPPAVPPPAQPPSPLSTGQGGGGVPSDDPGAGTVDKSEWRLHWLKEWVTAILGVAIVGVTLWLLAATFFAVQIRTVTAADVADPALNAAIQRAHQDAVEERQTVLAIAIGLVGVVTGYFFGRVPVELRARAAEASARTSANAADAAVSSRDEAQRTADGVQLKLADVRATMDRVMPPTATLSPNSSIADVELVALKHRMGWP